jgi:hypothetical protein
LSKKAEKKVTEIKAEIESAACQLNEAIRSSGEAAVHTRLIILRSDLETEEKEVELRRPDTIREKQEAIRARGLAAFKVRAENQMRVDEAVSHVAYFKKQFDAAVDELQRLKNVGDGCYAVDGDLRNHIARYGDLSGRVAS